MTLTPESPAAWRDTLRCGLGALPGLRLRWVADGVPWAGPVTTVEAPGDAIPPEALRSARRWRCEAVQDGRVVAAAEARVLQPPIVLVVVDDLGVGDVGAYGSLLGTTPRLDALAAEGVRWTAGYATAPVCGPSRAALITGRQQNRFGFEYNPTVVRENQIDAVGLPAAEQTLGELLRDAGYATAFIGKWHLGRGPEDHPFEHGFDHFFGFLNGGRPSLPPGQPGVLELFLSEDEVGVWPATLAGDLVLDGTEEATLDERHLTDRLADEAIAWLDGTVGTPAALVLSFNAPHTPLQAPPAHVALVPDPPADPRWLSYLATVAGLDAAVGRVLDRLDDLGLADDALVAFVSDNGCPETVVPCSNGILQGGKLRLEEGGIRVPMLLRWPGRVTPQVDDALVSAVDLLPTLLAAAGLPRERWPAPLDGEDLLPWLTGTTDTPPHAQLAWRIWPARAARVGPTKLVEVLGRRWLFDLAADPGERESVASAFPVVADSLSELLDVRAAEAYAEPAWPGTLWEGDYYGTTLPLVY